MSNIADTPAIADDSRLKHRLKETEAKLSEAERKLDETETKLGVFEQMVGDMPVNVMTLDLEDYSINYINKTSVDTLKTLEHLLPVPSDRLLGQCVDIFHKDPEHQRRILRDPKNLPYNAKIELGDEILDLLVTAIRDKDGKYIGPMLTWNIVTEQVKADAMNAQLQQMVDQMPTNVLMCDPVDFKVNYINKTSVETLKTLEHLLPVPSDQLMGQCIDIFHKNPEHQRRILGDPKNLPHNAKIQLGDEWLDLQVNAITDKDGKYIGPMLTWNIVTEQVKAEAMTSQLEQMVNQMPANVLMCDPVDFKINFINATSVKTLKPLEHLLPVRADQLMGQCIDIFHKNPEHQRRILGDPKNLPHNAKIQLGDEWLDLQVDAITDKDGNYIGPMLTWSVITEQVKAEAMTSQLEQMVNQMPANVLMCDPVDFKINFINATSVKTLKPLEHLLPVRADQLMGQCIDIFHKNPEHQRRILRDPKNLPYNAKIQLGEEWLDLQVDAITDKDDNYIGPMLTWGVITEKVSADALTAQLEQMVDQMPTNVLMCDPVDFKINFINKTSIDTLKPLEHLLPVRADQLMGQCIDIFHKNPEHQRRILRDPNNLPHSAKIQLGEEWLDLLVSAITNQAGEYLGPMLTWNVVTRQVKMADNFEANVKAVVEAVAGGATEMQTAAESLASTAEETSRQSQAAAAASEQASTNVQTVSSAAEELSSSIDEISRQVAQSATMAKAAVEDAQRTNATVQGLAEGSQKIGKVVELISDIASQTNLLALNATIEAARAGDAGRGFAVVASEVKSLANQTAKATDDIGTQINAIQSATSEAVTAIKGIGEKIGEMDEISTTIASSVEEQGAATGEISRNSQEAATGTQEVSTNIASVQEAATETGAATGQLLDGANDLAKQAELLRAEVEKFLVEVRAA